MPSDIRFLHKANGARIAYTSTGCGPPLLIPPSFVSHLGLALDYEPKRAWIKSLARDFTVIEFDRWGVGLSEPERNEWTREVEVETIEEVSVQLGLGQFAILGICGSGATTMMYAARHPERLTHLLLYGTYAHRPDLQPGPVEEWLKWVAENWGLATWALSHWYFADDDFQSIKGFRGLEIAAANGPTARKILRFEVGVGQSVAALAGTIQVPTLVMHRRDDSLIPFKLGVDLASCIPNARFAELHGDSHICFSGDGNSVLNAIRRFVLGADAVTEGGASEAIHPLAPAYSALSPRELEVLCLLAMGRKNQQIADEFTLSVSTVARHVSHIFEKLELSNRSEAVAFALRNGLAK
jgi:pimeloyl-ACP methyl ester carboxylesterase/DNA-binding CsgD family transcriptional regulator